MVPSKVAARCVQLPAGIAVPSSSWAAPIVTCACGLLRVGVGVEPVDQVARLLLDDQCGQPPTEAGLTQPSIVMPVVRSSELESGTVDRGVGAVEGERGAELAAGPTRSRC